ncbi:MAG: FkbM family methyltransferase [Formivibrio sp.]|nr:FkbM family methyltransferase [Formivibrio sp.]
MNKISALSNVIKFSRIGSGLKSKFALFNLALINHLNRNSRQTVIELSAGLLARCADPSGLICIELNLPTGKIRSTVRAGNFGDYYSAYECLSGAMYPLPLKPVQYVIDAGANIGFFTIYAVGNLGVSVLAIEPAPGNKDMLSNNIAELPHVEIVSVALAAAEGIATFELAAANTGHIDRFNTGNDSGQTCEVKTVRLPSLIPENWDPNSIWLKMDIEGAEYEVLRDLLQAGIKPVLISAELHDYYHSDGETFIRELREAGYTVTIEGLGENACCQMFASLDTDAKGKAHAVSH